MIPGSRDRSEGSADHPGTDSPYPEPVVLPLEDSIDLHAFSPKDIPSVVEEYIEQCSRAGINEARIIHGRGKGVQRRVVRSVLQRHALVHSFKDAPTEAGGWGATVVLLGSKGGKGTPHEGR